MADYPAVAQSPDTRIEPLPGAVISRAVNGKVHGRQYHDADQYDIESIHRFISVEDKDAILAVYDANRDLAINWTYAGDGTVYSVYFAQGQRPNAIRAPDTANLWHVTSRLTGEVAPPP